MQGEGGLGVAEGGRHGWMDRGGREEMRDGGREGVRERYSPYGRDSRT